ncbi:MAG: Asp-tRNA(Asn)/Glu-tRNA(Gln) amidotransferase subunit GatB, partial [Nitrospirae bacterium]
PDLPKGYQISQYELPLCYEGYLDIDIEGQTRRVRITRIHLEEDAGKNIHQKDHSLVDLNRAGVPLLELVTEPDIRSPSEAAGFMKLLRSIVRYLGISDGNMEEGSLRCDANVSVRPEGSDTLGVKTEIKNINSFRFVEKALEYEIKRQIEVLNSGGEVVQETRLFDSNTGKTYPMRSKEEAHDYRYFPEPDLVPLQVPEEWIEEIKERIPELPHEKVRRYQEELKLPQYDALILTEERPIAEWFERAVSLGGEPKRVSNWVLTELLKLVNEHKRPIEESPLRPEHLIKIFELIDRGTINQNVGKKVFEEVFLTGKAPEAIVEEKGLSQITDTSAMEKMVEEVLQAHPKEVERYRAGEQKLLGFFVGQVMKASKGKANPKVVNELIRKKLSG